MFIEQFYDFAHTSTPPCPYTGLSSVVTICKWLESLKERWPTVPRKDKYCFNTNNMKLVKKCNWLKKVRQKNNAGNEIKFG